MNKETKQFVKQGLQTIEELLSQGKHADAIKACQEILQVDPSNKKALKILEKEKKDIISRNLKSVKDLVKQEKYQQAIEIGEKLFQAGHDPTLKTAVTKAKEKALKAYLASGYKKHKELTKGGKWLDAIKLLQEMLKTNPHSEKIKEMLKRDKIRYIDRELHSDVKDKLIKNKEFEKLYKFYKRLYELFPEHKGLLKEIKNAEKFIFKMRRESNKAFADESIRRTKDFLSKKDYDAAIQAAKELISITDGEQGMSLYKKAVIENDKDTEIKLAAKLDKMVASIKEEFKSDSKKFVKV